MAELVWKGKQNLQKDDLIQQTATSTSYQCTTRSYYPAGEATDIAPLHSEGQYNRLIWGDKSKVLSALLVEFTGAINLIYIDPPFMTGRTFNHGMQVAYSDTWNNDLDSYLQWLYETLILLYKLLAVTGSLYIHLDWRVAHYARIMLDEIFGTSSLRSGPGFKNEIIWHYQSGGRAQKYYARKHDTILLYTKSGHYCFHSERVGERRGTQKRNHMRKEIGADGRITWTIRSAGRLYSYAEDTAMSLADVWHDISHLHQRDPERTGYATQKPEALLRRIIMASSEEQDIVLDCFCGSGVAPAVAEQLKRRWIACDSSELAIQMTCERLRALEREAPFALQYIARTGEQPNGQQEQQ